MKQVKRLTVVNAAMVRDSGHYAQDLVPLPPAPNWFARGPRGGVYLATGPRWRSASQDGDYWPRDQWAVMDWSEGARYIRPGSALHREADEADPA